MLAKPTISFLKNLAKNNNKIWFDEHRKDYESAKKDFEIFIDALLNELSDIEPSFTEQKAKEITYRIFRDVRFGKDKSPYKSNFGAYLRRGGKKSFDAGFYLHLEPDGKCFLAGGIWMPEADILKKLRQEVDYNLHEFEAILTSSSFKKHFNQLEGERLKKAPKDYLPTNPAIEYLKMKSFMVKMDLTDDVFMDKQAVKQIAKFCKVLKPFIDFLNRALD